MFSLVALNLNTNVCESKSVRDLVWFANAWTTSTRLWVVLFNLAYSKNFLFLLWCRKTSKTLVDILSRDVIGWKACDLCIVLLWRVNYATQKRYLMQHLINLKFVTSLEFIRKKRILSGIKWWIVDKICQLEQERKYRGLKRHAWRLERHHVDLSTFLYHIFIFFTMHPLTLRVGSL